MLTEDELAKLLGREMHETQNTKCCMYVCRVYPGVPFYVYGVYNKDIPRHYQYRFPTGKEAELILPGNKSIELTLKGFIRSQSDKTHNEPTLTAFFDVNIVFDNWVSPKGQYLKQSGYTQKQITRTEFLNMNLVSPQTQQRYTKSQSDLELRLVDALEHNKKVIMPVLIQIGHKKYKYKTLRDQMTLELAAARNITTTILLTNELTQNNKQGRQQSLPDIRSTQRKRNQQTQRKRNQQTQMSSVSETTQKSPVRGAKTQRKQSQQTEMSPVSGATTQRKRKRSQQTPITKKPPRKKLRHSN